MADYIISPSDNGEQKRFSFTVCLVFILLVLVVAGVQLKASSTQEYSPSEAHVIELALERTQQENLLSLAVRNIYSYATDHILLDIWVSLFGRAEIITRLLSILATLLGLSLLFRLGADLFGIRGGMFAAFLLGFFGLFQSLGLMTHIFSILILATTAAHLIFMRWLRNPNRKYAALYLLFALLSVYTHPLGVYVVVAHLVFSGSFVSQPRALRVKTFQLLAATIIVVLPRLLIVMVHEFGHRGNVGFPGSNGIFEEFIFMFPISPAQFFQLAIIVGLAINIKLIASTVNRDFRFSALWGMDWRNWYSAILLSTVIIVALPVYAFGWNPMPVHLLLIFPPLILLAVVVLLALPRLWQGAVAVLMISLILGSVSLPHLYIPLHLFLLAVSLFALVVFIRGKRNLFIVVLSLVLVAVAALQILVWQQNTSRFWIFSPDGTHDAASIFSAVLAFFCGLTLVAISLVSGVSRFQRIYLRLMAAVFGFIAVGNFITISAEWRIVYFCLAVVFVFANLTAFRRRHDDGFGMRSKAFLLITAGLIVFIPSSFFARAILYDLCRSYPGSDVCTNVLYMPPFAAIFKFTGSIIILVGILIYAQNRLGAAEWKRMQRVLAGGGAIAMLLATVYIWAWVLPDWNSSFFPVEVEYLDGDLELIGYRMPEQTVAPGEPFNAFLYWRANAPLYQEYGLSVHLLAKPEMDSASHADEAMGAVSSRLWPLDIIVRDAVQLNVPDDLNTPSSYWLTLNTWYYTDVLVSLPITMGEILFEDTLPLSAVPALSTDSILSLQTTATYQFAEGFRLSGYDLPDGGAVGDDLTLRFWWETDEFIDRQLVQFIHLFKIDGDEFAVFDREPFGGSFPTQDWPGGIAMVDDWNITLPDDLLPGEYRAYTGMYVPISVERIAVTDGDGQVMQDALIYLGTVVIEQ